MIRAKSGNANEVHKRLVAKAVSDPKIAVAPLNSEVVLIMGAKSIMWDSRKFAYGVIILRLSPFQGDRKAGFYFVKFFASVVRR